MNTWNPDSLHRLAKALADSGEAETLEVAHEAFSRYGIHFVIHQSAMADEALQNIALTAINAASRSFMGNVRVSGCVDEKLSANGFGGTTLRQFADWLGIRPDASSLHPWAMIFIGAAAAEAPAGSIRPWAEGWRFGLGLPRSAAPVSIFAPACIAAGGLAVSEAFSIMRGDNPYSGRRQLELSLWSPTDPMAQGPKKMVMPRSWLVGLGHLGQAFAWTMGFMSPPRQAVYLQDFDVVTESTLSTSMLSAASDVGQAKSDVVSGWLRARGYDTFTVAHRFSSAQRVAAGDPRVALFGVDNAAARRVSESAGFEFVVDTGLGSGFNDFRAIRVRTFPGPSTAADLWALDADLAVPQQMPAYQHLLSRGAEACGVTTLASRAVGAPFVGCVAAGYALAELVKHELGIEVNAVIDTNLRDPHAIEAVCSMKLRATTSA